MSEQKTFFDMVNSNPTLSDRMTETTAAVMAMAKANYGATLTLEEVASLVNVRAAVLGAEKLDTSDENFIAELEKVKSVAGRNYLQTKKQKSVKAEAEAEPESDSAYLNRAARIMTEARANPKAASAAFDPARLNDAEKLAYILTQPASTRMALAREWGVGV